MSGGGIGISYKAVKLELARLLKAGLLPATGESGLDAFVLCCKRAANDARVEGGVLSEDSTAKKGRGVVWAYVDEILEDAGFEVPVRVPPKAEARRKKGTK